MNHRQFIAGLACALFLLHLPFLTHFFLEKGIEIVELDGQSRTIAVMSAQPSPEPNRNENPSRTILCSHGTNSHKEVFFFFARLLSWRGTAVLSNDAGALSTDEGLPTRIDDLLGLRSYGQARHSGAESVIDLFCHSDGCPPSVAAKNHHPGLFSGKIGVMGSFLIEPYRGKSPILGLSGWFDQIFPTDEMKADILAPDRDQARFLASPLSDHFTEQYDPFLLAEAARFFTAKPDADASPFDKGDLLDLTLLILLVSAISVTVFFAGSMVMSTENRVLSGAVLALCWAEIIFVPSRILVSGWITMCLLGMCVSWAHIRRFIPVFIGFTAATELNICLASALWRADPVGNLPGLAAFVLWYPIAWIAKITLYFPYLLGKLTWATGRIPVILVVPTLVALWGCRAGVRPERAGKIIPPASSPTSPISSFGRQRRLAGLLTIIAVGLWGIRFLQGMVQPEILQAVAGNYLRTLLLPTVYLLVVLRRWQIAGINK